MKKKARILKWDPLGWGEDIVYCDAPYCESPASKTVPVSEDEAGDSTRNLCAPCAEAYAIGVQHGTFRTLAELRADLRNPVSKRRQRGKGSLGR